MTTVSAQTTRTNNYSFVPSRTRAAIQRCKLTGWPLLMGLRLRFCPLFDKLEESRELILEGGIFCDDGIFTFIYTYIYWFDVSNSFHSIIVKSNLWLLVYQWELINVCIIILIVFWFLFFCYFNVFGTGILRFNNFLIFFLKDIVIIIDLKNIISYFKH